MKSKFISVNSAFQAVWRSYRMRHLEGHFLCETGTPIYTMRNPEPRHLELRSRCTPPFRMLLCPYKVSGCLL
jgi:hypothetical protein